jgi:hypothetical protein
MSLQRLTHYYEVATTIASELAYSNTRLFKISEREIGFLSR